MQALIDKLIKEQKLSRSEWITLIKNRDTVCLYARQKASEISRQNFGNKIYIRGLIELTNYCKNDCYYCGIRAGNKNCSRYRLTKEQVLECCRVGYPLGFRTFVLQGGEDAFYTDDYMCSIVSAIKKQYSDCAITLSLGERSHSSYKRLYDAGANRYLLRHETATNEHYSKLHPSSLSLENRKQCLYNLKEIGYQVGTGFMVGSPYQTEENLADDMVFISELGPQMIGIGPFLSHSDTPFKDMPNGSLELSLFMLSLCRLMFPKVLLPSTTALATLDKNGRNMGILSGANVIMPNLSPAATRKNYLLYNDKACTDEEAAEGLEKLKQSLHSIGYEISYERGDYKE
ncbi:MAG: [FeFe] hydrogenase H-cluster radical SAM maturase HydE [Ruminococcaceae bacterium]|nr:[FeFe] hydrogenase H-cluster radical SAM maturase HydE [Oscillospiraceae bacterium]